MVIYIYDRLHSSGWSELTLGGRLSYLAADDPLRREDVGRRIVQALVA